MKITVDAKSFAEAIQWSTKGFDPKNDKAYIALSVDSEGFGHLSHTSLTSYMRAPLTVTDVDLDGSEDALFALDGKYLQKLAGALSSGPVVLDSSSGSLLAKGKDTNFTIPTFKADPPKEPKFSTLGEVSDVEFFDYLQRVSKLCDPNNAGQLPALGCVDIRLDRKNESLSMMATDRYNLSEVKVDFSPATDLESVIDDGKIIMVPHENASMVSPSKNASQVELIYDKKTQKFGYHFNDGRMALFALKDAKPIEYTAIISKSTDANTNGFVVNTRDLQKAISVVSSLDWNSTYIHMLVTEDSVQVTDDNRTNKISLELESIEVEGEHEIKFVKAVVNSAFSPIATSKVKLNFSDSKNPFTLEAVLDNDDVADNVFVLTVPNP